MNMIDQGFYESLKSGFIDKSIISNRDFHPRLLINDQSSEQRVLTTIEQELNRCEEFWFSVAFITTSGVASIINTLETLESKGVNGKILASQYQNFTQPEALKRLLKFSNIELKISVNRNFHSKGYLFKSEDLYNLIIGSSNLTASALSRNVEWNLKVSAKPESRLMHNMLNEYQSEFRKGVAVTKSFIDQYELEYQESKNKLASANLITDVFPRKKVEPNKMQTEALSNLERLRSEGRTKALLVSATGTGKTFLSAFDARSFDAERLLFVVHRANISKAAMASFREVFGYERSMGLYSGGVRESDSEFIFCTIQTLSRHEHLHRFPKDHFDYIIIDESHRAGARTYQSILNHFKPKFLLGMTATPERTDGFDIFNLYDHTIAYEIRLHRALAEDMLSPFHYYGITDLSVDDRVIEDVSDFSLLSSKERINRIIEKASFYGTDTGQVRGLVFCSRVEECISLASAFNQKGIPSLALTGSSTEDERTAAINRLESELLLEKLDYIFTVDIFNEGVDIPQVNQVIMLRPTQSAIIFVQQMGRGLRKTLGKKYLTIIDFIGNYNNNYLVPIALYGDNSYNKDKLRKLIKGGSRSIPGSSTINFDRISKDRIFASIDQANMKRKRDLTNDYELLKFELGRPPMMRDFLEHGSRDPFLYVEYAKSFFSFAETQEDNLKDVIQENDKKILEAFSREINNAKRIEEPLILRQLINEGIADLNQIAELIQEVYKYTDPIAMKSAIHNLNLKFVRAKSNGKLLPLDQIHQVQITKQDDLSLSPHPDFQRMLQNSYFKQYLRDSVDYAIRTFDQLFNLNSFKQGFLLYQKYSRKDVFRILCWENNPVAQNVGGYKISNDKNNCPIFVTYHKAEDISESTKYEDYFINNSTFTWMSKANRKLESSDVQTIKHHKEHSLRIPLFIKKNDDEGQDFYYVGDIFPIDDSFEQTTIRNDQKKLLPVVKLLFRLDHPVEDAMYNYLTEG